MVRGFGHPCRPGPSTASACARARSTSSQVKPSQAKSSQVKSSHGTFHSFCLCSSSFDANSSHAVCHMRQAARGGPERRHGPAAVARAGVQLNGGGKAVVQLEWRRQGVVQLEWRDANLLAQALLAVAQLIHAPRRLARLGRRARPLRDRHRGAGMVGRLSEEEGSGVVRQSPRRRP
jgi:hypothetical protein